MFEPGSRPGPCLQVKVHTVQVPERMRAGQPWETEGCAAEGLDLVNADPAGASEASLGLIFTGLEAHVGALFSA